jgi:hypothetical protein
LKTKTPEAKVIKGEVKEDDLKKHPLYLEIEQQYNKLSSSYQEDIERAKKEVEESFASRYVTDSVVKTAFAQLTNLKPVLPKNETAKNLYMNAFEDKLRKFKYQKSGDITLVLDPETGNRLDKNNGHPWSADEFINDMIRKSFDLEIIDDKGSPGGKGSSEGPGKVKKVGKWSSTYDIMIAKQKGEITPQEAREAKAAFLASQGG